MRIFGLLGLVLVLAAAGCQAGDPPVLRNVSEVTEQDVVDAWDEHCGFFNFDTCPSNVLNPVLCDDTLEDVYNGGHFEDDCSDLMEVMRDELNAGPQLPPRDPDDLLNLVITDEYWFE